MKLVIFAYKEDPRVKIVLEYDNKSEFDQDKPIHRLKRLGIDPKSGSIRLVRAHPDLFGK